MTIPTTFLCGRSSDPSDPSDPSIQNSTNKRPNHPIIHAESSEAKRNSTKIYIEWLYDGYMNPWQWYDYIPQEKHTFFIISLLKNQRFETTIFHPSPHCFAYALRFVSPQISCTVPAFEASTVMIKVRIPWDSQRWGQTSSPRNPYESPTIDHPGLMVEKSHQ